MSKLNVRPVDVLGPHKDEPLSKRRERFDLLFAPARNLTADEFFRHRWYEPVRFSCACCGFPTHAGRGYAEFCVVCFWRDDGRDDAEARQPSEDADNAPWSLEEARINFVNYGAMYAPGRRNLGSIRGEVHPSTVEAKRALVERFYQVLTVDPTQPTWMERWLEALRASQDLLRVRGRARAKSSERRKITVGARLPESEQPWRKAPPGLPGMLRRGTAERAGLTTSGERVSHPRHSWREHAADNYLRAVREATSQDGDDARFSARIEGWLLFVSCAWSRARHEENYVPKNPDDARTYLHNELPEALVRQVFTVVDNAQCATSMETSERAELIRRTLLQCEALQAQILAITKEERHF